MTDFEPAHAVTFGVKVTADYGHIHFDLFAGRAPDSRGRVGSLVLRPDEFDEFIARLNPESIQPDHIQKRYDRPHRTEEDQ